MRSRLAEVRAQHPQLTDEEADARAAFRLLTSASLAGTAASTLASAADGAATTAVVSTPGRTVSAEDLGSATTPRVWTQHAGQVAWRLVKLPWAVAVLLLAAKAARCEPRRPLPAAFRNITLFAEPQQPSGIIVQFQNGGTALATRPAGLVIIDCETNMSCSWSGGKFQISSSGSGGGSSATFQANGTNTSSQTTINWQSGTNITISNPSLGNVAFNLSGQSGHLQWRHRRGNSWCGHCIWQLHGI